MKSNVILAFRLISILLIFFKFNIGESNAQSKLPGSGKSLYLDGINDYLEAGNNNRGVTNKVTIEAWVKTSALSLSWVAGKYSNSLGEDAGYEFFVTNGYAALYGRDGSGIYRTSGPSTTFVADNKWHHIAGVVNNGTWEVWVDGNLENKFESNYTSVRLTTQEANFCIGIYQGYNDTNFKGNIDEVRLWNTARTEKQLRDNMCLKLTGKEPNLVGYFTFDEPVSNSLFTDYSSSKLNARLVNINSATVQELSGAPLGDVSKNLYKTTNNGTWDSNYTDFSDLDFVNFQLTNVSENIKGVHLYRVNSDPNSSDGLPETARSGYYYGVYTVGGDSQPVNYTVNLKTKMVTPCIGLYKRENNANLSWNMLPATFLPSTNTILMTDESYRGEYIVDEGHIMVTVSGKTEICVGASTTLQAKATGVLKFLWNTGATTSSLVVDQAGTYTVKAFTTDQCFTEASVTVKMLVTPAVTITGDTYLCPKSSVLLNANGVNFTKYLWSTGDTTKSINVSKAGTYSVKAFTNDLCFSESSVVVNSINNLAQVAITGKLEVCPDSSIILTAKADGAERYLWNTGESSDKLSVTKAGTYTVKAFFENQCFSEASIQITQRPEQDCMPPALPVIIPNIITPNGDNLNEAFVIKNITLNKWQLKIFNRWGELVYISTNYKNDWNAKDVSDGVYYYVLIEPNNAKNYKGYLEVIR